MLFRVGVSRSCTARPGSLRVERPAPTIPLQPAETAVMAMARAATSADPTRKPVEQPLKPNHPNLSARAPVVRAASEILP